MIDMAAMTNELNVINYHRDTTSWIRFFKSLDSIILLDKEYENLVGGEESTDYIVEEIQDEIGNLERYKARLQTYYDTRQNDIGTGEFDVLTNILNIIEEAYG